MNGTHKCPAPPCDKRVPYNQLACRGHWFAIPQPMRNRVGYTYREMGQGSAEHLEAITAAIEWLKAKYPAA